MEKIGSVHATRLPNGIWVCIDHAEGTNGAGSVIDLMIRINGGKRPGNSVPLVENEVRSQALGRKNYLFAGSHGSAHNIAVLYRPNGNLQKLRRQC